MALNRKPPESPDRSPLSLTQQQDLPVRPDSPVQQEPPVKTPAADDGPLSNTGEKDLPLRQPVLTETPRGGGGTDHADESLDGGLGLKPADILAGRYEIRGCIGRGGMGAVFSAFDRLRNDEVALKVLLPRLLLDPQARDRFTNEARIASSLSHPNIVRVYDLQQDGDKTFLTMELLQGKSLREEIVARQARAQRFTVEEVRRVGDQLCDALAHAHKQTIHRDVKPENIWLLEDGTVKLMDFGIARLLRPSQFTSLGLGMGTAYYMAPEQLKAQKEIDHRADQYAVAVVLYELLTGEIPQGMVKTPHEVRKSIPVGLSQAVTKALAGPPAERFADMAALRNALHSRGAGQHIPRWAVAAACVGLLAVVGTYPYWGRLVPRQGGAHQTGERASLPLAAAEQASDTQGDGASAARLAKSNAAQAKRGWEKVAGKLPEGFAPAEAEQGKQSLTAAEKASAAREYPQAATTYDRAAELLETAREQGEELRRQIDTAHEQLKPLVARRAKWQKLSKGLPADQLPANAEPAEVAYRLVQTSLTQPDTLALVGDRVTEAIELYDSCISAVTQKQQTELAVAKNRAKLELDEGQALLAEIKSAVKEAERSLAHAKQGKVAGEITQAETDLAHSKRLLAIYEHHPLAPTWHDEASAALVAGETLARDDAAAARQSYEKGEAAAKKLVTRLKHAPEALYEIQILEAQLKVREEKQSDPAADLYAWPESRVKAALETLSISDAQVDVTEIRQIAKLLPEFDSALGAREKVVPSQRRLESIRRSPKLTGFFKELQTSVSRADTALREGRVEKAKETYQTVMGRYDALLPIANLTTAIEGRVGSRGGTPGEVYASLERVLEEIYDQLASGDMSPALAETRRAAGLLTQFDEAIQRRGLAIGKQQFFGSLRADAALRPKIEAADEKFKEADTSLGQGRADDANRLYTAVVESYSVMGAIRNSIGMKLTFIPAGEFEMGSHEGALKLLNRFDYATPANVAGEGPVHVVRITKPFYMGVYEVTLGEFLKFYHAANYRCECQRDGKGGWGWTGETFEQRRAFTPWGWGFSGQTQEHPVVNVTWNDAVAFCAWLSKKEGHKYRLPTEAEWEYACRARTTTRFYFGEDPEELVLHANVADLSNKGIWPKPERVFIAKWENGKVSNATIPFPFLRGNDGFGFSAPVGSFRANAFGLCDMAGNAWEWCSDWYAYDYYANSPSDDPQGPAAGSVRVIRGGGWNFYPVYCRSAARYFDGPAYRYGSTGFRVVRSR